MSENVPAEKKHHHHHKSSYSLCENMFILFMITFAAGVFCYEKNMTESFMKIYRTAVFAICIFMWLAISFFSGSKNKWQFEVFSVLFWIVPLLIIYLANNGPEFCRMSITMYLLSEFFTIMFITPAELIGSLLKLGAVPVIIIMVLVCSFAFLAGNLLSDKLKKGNYTF